ncbi:predicted protein [Nematostella vectensis]|uniref:J domain-containing protein n=1 Tax=Nematostella vectensis TaxID=45351 RepID=A7S1H0_NEMVE|nr:dnaJ homolog subfamily C member 9 [Nematostella vectensis]EDO42458.1 predicted protein [Nematostella vectensis]|eukprot:XP_001634521.1 predicted protein [Nematostella vectensis]
MPFLDELDRLFGVKNLYDVLGVSKTASESEIKRAYRKISLQVHPDRADKGEKEKATRKFQALSKSYCILSDKEKRAIYDESGEIDEENIDEDRDWTQYWRLLFKKVTLEDIRKFEASYKGSDEELSDLMSAYEDYKGDMDQIMENMLCSNDSDEDRFAEILQGLIKEKKVPKYKTFTHESKAKKNTRRKKAQQEAAEAEEMATELGLGNNEGSLQSLILKRQTDRAGALDSMIAGLEAKYCKPKKSKASTTKKQKKT